MLGLELRIGRGLSLIHNERLKLLATGFNNLGIASIVSGFLAPAGAQLYGTMAVEDAWRGVALFTIWLSLGVLLMCYAQSVLGGLKE